MTKFFRNPGDTVTLVAPAGGVVAGQGYVVGAIFVVAIDTAAAGANFAGYRVGVHNLTRNAADVFTQGQRVWWNDTTKEFINVTAIGAFSVGAAIEAQSAGAGRIQVVLDGTFVLAS